MIRNDDIVSTMIVGGILLFFILLIVFLGWSLVVWIFSWAFGFEFMWRYVIGAWLGTLILRRIFGRSK